MDNNQLPLTIKKDTGWIGMVDILSSPYKSTVSKYKVRRVLAHDVHEEDAEFIIRSCNLYYDLVEKLENTTDLIDQIINSRSIQLNHESDWAILNEAKELLLATKDNL